MGKGGQITTDAFLENMLKEAAPVFDRQAVARKLGQNQFESMGSNSTRWDQRVKSFYDPGIKDKNYNRWDVKKVGVLDSMKKNKSLFLGNSELLKNIGGLKKITHLERKFPTFARFMALPPASIGNDAHNKSTNPGYSRN